MTAPGTDLRITCFGELRIELAGRDVTSALPGRQGRALFAYLAVATRRASRDELIDALWPSSPPARPDAAFRSVLAKVRRALPDGLVTGRESLALQVPPGAAVDVRDVRRSVAHAERALDDGDAAAALDAAQAALTVLARPLLPDLGGEWVDAARAEFEAMQLRALEIVARAGLSIGSSSVLAAAEQAAEQLVELQPFREDRYALLMDAQEGRGNSAEALRTFERLRVLLRDELGASPSAEILAIHESLLRGEVRRAATATDVGGSNGGGLPVPAVAPRTSEGVFVGREECLRHLEARWKDSRDGRTGVVLLVGDAGVGKTRLATRFAEHVHRDGGAVLYGRADAEALLPYQPFAEALDHLVSHAGPEFLADVESDLAILNRLFPTLRPNAMAPPAPVDEETLRYQAFEAVVRLLERASAGWPVLLILDDLHWADKPTLLLLRHVLRHAEGTRLLVLGTSRHVDRRSKHPLVDLRGDLRREGRRYDRLTLDGLDEEATHALVVDRFGGDVTAGFVRRLQRQTKGNAFYIEETVRALEDSGPSRAAVLGEEALDEVGVPEGVEEVIVRRVRQLSALAADVLIAASVIGPTFRLGIVEQLVEGDPEIVMGAIEEGLAAGLVLEVTDEVDVFTFSHALVRDALYKQFTGTRLLRLHHRVAMALERLAEREPVNPAELAHHFALARHVAGPGPARRYAIAAGRRAAELFAYEEAAAHFRRALELFEDGDERGRCEVLLALGRVEWHAGDDGARKTFVAAAKSAKERGAADQLARAALGLGERWFEVTYLGAPYRHLLEQALAAIGPDDSPERALLLSRLAATLAFPNENDAAHAHAEAAVSIARRLGDEKLLAAVLLVRHVTLLDVRHIEQRIALSHEPGLLGAEHQELAAELHHWRMYDLLGVGDMEAARREYAELEAFAERLAQPLFRSLAFGARGLWAELAGDVALAESCADESLRQARLAHTKDALSSWACQVFALRRRSGDLETLAKDVKDLAESGGRQIGWGAALGVLRFETGDVDEARSIYGCELAKGPEGLSRGMFWLTRMALLSELSAMLGDAAGAERLYAALAPYARWNVVVAYCSFWGPVESYLALLAETFGDHERAAQHVASAFARVRAMNAPALIDDLERRHAKFLHDHRALR